MNRFRSVVLGAGVVIGFAVAFSFSPMPAQAKQCSAERPANARTYWSYRLIDGRKCWYEGKPMLSKSLLHWSTVRTAQAGPRRAEPNIVPENHYNLLDAQASISDDLEAKPKPEAKPEIADSGLARTGARPLTPDGLRVFANSMAAMTAEPVVTILDRWPDEEMPQQRTKPAPAEQPSPTNSRTIMMVAIMLMALLAVLITTLRKVRGARHGGGSLLLGYSDLTWRRPEFTPIKWTWDPRA
jgi:hypothetical protein